MRLRIRLFASRVASSEYAACRSVTSVPLRILSALWHQVCGYGNAELSPIPALAGCLHEEKSKQPARAYEQLSAHLRFAAPQKQCNKVCFASVTGAYSSLQSR